MFDATASTVGASGALPFHDLIYAFNFGDSAAGNWALTGLPKNTQTGGPLAAFVFERPGTYTVTVRAEAPNGQFSQTSTQVVVTDPAVHYAGARTVCVSTSANYSGCPAGAVQQTILPIPLSGKRVLLRRGESFPTIHVRHTDDDVQVATFGTGAKPRVAHVQISDGRPSSANFPEEITIMDLDVANGISQIASTARLLLLRNDLDDPGVAVVNQIDLAAALHYWAVSDPWREIPTSAFYQPREIFVVENRVIGTATSGTATAGNLFGIASRLALLGNEMGRADQHTVRLFNAHKTVLSHNHLKGISAGGAQHPLKLHSGGFGEYHDNYEISGQTWRASQIVIADNIMSDPQDNNYQTLTVRPQNAGENSGEGIEDVVIENNRFHRGPNTNADIILVGRRMTSRGNTRMSGGAPAIHVEGISSSYPHLPAEWRGPYFLR